MSIRSGLNASNSTMQTHLGLEKPGTIKPWSGATVPTGWLALDGANVSRTTYPNVFGIYGTTYGSGDGSTTFGLPDSQGRMIIGAGGYVDPVSGFVFRNIGVKSGNEAHQITISESGMVAHAHALNDSSFTVGNHQHLTFAGHHVGAIEGLDVGPLKQQAYNSASTFAYSLRVKQTPAVMGATSFNGSHQHTVTGYISASTGFNAAQVHSNLQPYVAHIWIVKV